MNKVEYWKAGYQQKKGQLESLEIVREVVLERLMTSQRTLGWKLYNGFRYGMTRGFLREAVNCTDLAEGVHLLCMARTNAFPSVEGAWQRITRSGYTPAFKQGKCPLCQIPIKSGREVSHLLVDCQL
jgi:hypothetical protein